MGERLWYEVFWTCNCGLALIMKVEINYLDGMLYALASIIIGFVYAHERLIAFTILGNLFYEFLAGVTL
jgi:hypothetical protein